MSQENVEIVRDMVVTFNSDGPDASLEYWADDLDHRAVEGAPDDPGPIHGKEGMRAYVQDWVETFEDFRTEPVEVIDGGDDTVVAVLKASGRAKQSGVETDLTYAVVYTIRDGKIARGREYMGRDQALEAAGLSN
jgi:ketosteroid isomerase-like protein